MKVVLILLAILAILPQLVVAKGNDATITRKFGSVKILSKPSTTLKKTEKQVLYDGKYYSVKKAKRGQKLGNGEVIQTGKGARARLVFDNGDQFTVSALSSYKIAWGTKGSKPEVNLLMGTLRSSVKKGGPRSGMKVRTRSMVMGVRGTDFFVRARDARGQSEVTVLRGQVLAVPTGVKNPKPVKVSTGYSLNIGPEAKESAIKKKRKRKVKVALTKTTPKRLEVIQKVTKVKKSIPASKATPEDLKQEQLIAELEKKALKTTLSDIKEYDPILHDRLKKSTENGDDIDAVEDQIHKARVRKQTPKLGREKPDLGAESEDVYEKYYTPL